MLFRSVYYVRSDMLDFKPGNNYYCDAFGGLVLHVQDRFGDTLRCFVLRLDAIFNSAFSPRYDSFEFDVQRAAISRCEFVSVRIDRWDCIFFASERCSDFVLGDFRDNFVNYTPF